MNLITGDLEILHTFPVCSPSALPYDTSVVSLSVAHSHVLSQFAQKGKEDLCVKSWVRIWEHFNVAPLSSPGRWLLEEALTFSLHTGDCKMRERPWISCFPSWLGSQVL